MPIWGLTGIGVKRAAAPNAVSQWGGWRRERVGGSGPARIKPALACKNST